MFNISTYLDKILKKIDSGEHTIHNVAGVIEKYTHITIPHGEIQIRNNIAYISSSVHVKNKIFLYKEKIIQELEPYSISDVR